MPSPSALDCGCEYFPNGVPSRYKVTISGMANNGSCDECDSFNDSQWSTTLTTTA